jgi:hypothetical protein
MVHDARTQSEKVNLQNLVKERDPRGRKSYLSVYVDLKQEDWDAVLKQRVEEVRRNLDEREAREIDFHTTFDRAYLGVERAAGTGANGAAVFVSVVNDFEEVHALSRDIETDVILDIQPHVTPLTG